MAKCILIVVSDGFGGYGDFLFALKLSAQLNEFYAKQGPNIPLIYIITQKSAMEKIKDLKGDTEFNATILTPFLLKNKFAQGELEVDHIIEGPVFQSELINQIDIALSPSPRKIPLTMIPEYTLNTPNYRSYLTKNALYRKKLLNNIKYVNTIYSGFKSDSQEKGILLSKELIAPFDPETMYNQLEENIRFAIFQGKSITDYRQSTNLSLQYSHDSFTTTRIDSSIKHYLNTHVEFIKNNNKNEDVFVIGKTFNEKIDALEQIKEKLINNKFTHICLYDVDEGINTVIHDAGTKKSYRMLYSKGISHPTMIACTALSGPLMGATGDQSLGEAISANKIIIYECLRHKKELILNYHYALTRQSQDNPLVRETLSLLHTAELEEDYTRLGELIRNPAVCHSLTNANKSLYDQYDFITAIVDQGLGWKPLLVQKIINYLKEGHSTDALDLFLDHYEMINLFDQFEGETIYQYALNNNNSAFLNHFANNPTELLMQYLLAGQQSEVWSFMQNNNISPLSTIINGKPIFNIFLNLKLYDLVDNVLLTKWPYSEKLKLIAQLTDKNTDRTYLSQLRSDRPASEYATTEIASSLVVAAQLDNYKPQKGSKRELMFESFRELMKTFQALSTYDENALIGLLLLNKKNIADEYRLFSPDNVLFGSRFYGVLKEALIALDVDMNSISLEQEKNYYQSLANTINKNPNFLGNEYILQSLSQQAHIHLNKISPLVTDKEASRILSKKKSDDPTILMRSEGFYKINPETLGKGGWGTVYAGYYYSKKYNGISKSTPLALKKMPLSQKNLLNKELYYFQKACPECFFDQFEHKKQSYFVMPLFPGLPLDAYLISHPHLDQGKRKDIVKKLLAELSSIHQYGITHNDIKPKNLLYDPVSHSIHIIDFGCAEDVGNQIKYQYLETAKYAIEYMPPEYLEGVVSSPANDMYSLSLCIAEILGIDKFLLVQNRLERTLKDIHNEDFKTSILSAFNAAQSLDHALFAPLMDKFRNSDILQQFINLYVNTAYDFLPFKDHLGDHMITLLDQLQNKDHVNRPDIAQCLEYMDNSSLIDVNNMTDKFEKK